MNQFNEKIEESRAVNKTDIDVPTQTHTWRYHLRDLLDEAIIGVILLAAVTITCMSFRKTVGDWIWWLEILVAMYVLWLAYLVFVRRLCTVYKLTPQNFIIQRGFFVQNTIYIELFNIEQVNLKRNLWERIIGVGTIRLSVKKARNESGEGDRPKIDRERFLEMNIPGMADFEHVRELIDNYRLYARQNKGVVFTT